MSLLDYLPDFFGGSEEGGKSSREKSSGDKEIYISSYEIQEFRKNFYDHLKASEDYNMEARVNEVRNNSEGESEGYIRFIEDFEIADRAFVEVLNKLIPIEGVEVSYNEEVDSSSPCSEYEAQDIQNLPKQVRRRLIESEQHSIVFNRKYDDMIDDLIIEGSGNKNHISKEDYREIPDGLRAFSDSAKTQMISSNRNTVKEYWDARLEELSEKWDVLELEDVDCFEDSIFCAPW
ncbi:MAG: hypothetical protein SVV03_06750 [Candidatus Nanohaloarchaea archaeon]|nr:hypothetical protein [Candidatus Nanohaloarchaea archaeon]